MKKAIIYLVFIFLPLTLFAQKKYYVKINGSPSLTGTSWGWASNSIQAMLDKAVAGDTIFVGVGTYYGGFTMKEGVSIKGGYTANSDNPSERYNVLETDDPSKQTILDGGLNQRVIMQYVPFSTSTIWEGLVIQNGKPSVEWQAGSIIYSKEGDSKIIGVIYKYNPEDHKGMIFGLEEVQKQWGGYETELSLPVVGTSIEAGEELSGKKNTQLIIENFPDGSLDFREENNVYNGNYAAYWCDTLTTGGYENWYLPSEGELLEIYISKIQSVLKSLGKDLKKGYWSSSHAGNRLAWSYSLLGGSFNLSLKYADRSVSAVHSFDAPENPEPVYLAGGGVFLKDKGILKNCLIKNNESQSRGGGVYVAKGGELIGCVVEGNNAPEGKEVYYESPLSIEKSFLQQSGELTVYPNPVKKGEYLYVEQPEISGNIVYQFINYAGISVSQGKLNKGQNRIEVPRETGVYLLVLRINNKILNSKIIIH